MDTGGGSPPYPYYIVYIPDLRLAVCSQHASAYTQANIGRHLRDGHRLTYAQRLGAVAALTARGLSRIPADVARPADDGAPVEGLPIHNGYRCTATLPQGERCRYLSRHLGTIQEHCRAKHKVRARRSGTRAKVTAEQRGFEEARMQSLYSSKTSVDYFTVQAADLGESSSQDLGLARSIGTQVGGRQVPGAKEISKSVAAVLREDFDLVQQAQADRYRKLEPVSHISELTPWLRSSGFQAHLEGVDMSSLSASFCLPRGERRGDAELAIICSSIERVLRRGMAALAYSGGGERAVSRLNAKLLNTFRRLETSQDPIKPLQEENTRVRYIRTWQELVCYFFRVKRYGALDDGLHMFVETDGQAAAAVELETAARAYLSYQERSGSTGGREEGSVLLQLLDRQVISFSMALVRHKLAKRTFDSAIVSFAAALAWNYREGSWKPIGDYTSYLSQLIYDCQLLVLRHCEQRDADDGRDDLSAVIVEFRDSWLLADTPGPIGELQSLRLLGMEIAKNTVGEAQIRWSEDGETIVYGDVQLSMQAIRSLVAHELDAATTTLENELFFNLTPPELPHIHELRDNWDARSPGASFITDGRNSGALSDKRSWLFEAVTGNPELASLFLRRDILGRWYADRDATAQYELTVQRFLKHLMVLVYMGSGQPPRRTELLGMRWCNVQADLRNVFLHDGHVVFILTYHKTLGQSNASRFPVRVLLPSVAGLLIRYLIYVIPFRVWLSHKAGDAQPLRESVWADRHGVWPEDRVTSALESASRAAIGTRLTVQAWRQIATGIANKKFNEVQHILSSEAAAVAGGAGPTPNERLLSSLGIGIPATRGLPDALHFQASHTPQTANRVYGGTINFRAGLTDAGLQEYIHVSKVWHRFLQPTSTPTAGKHSRSHSAEPDSSPLAKRIAIRGPRQHCRRAWAMSEAREALQHMYGPGAQYKSVEQEEAVQSVVSGLSPVVVIMGTGGGKSLLYMLLHRLPGAGTTVLVVPLVSLKQDTIRRCEQFGVECGVWREGQFRTGVGTPLIVVSLEQAVGSAFKGFLQRLSVAGQLGAIVFDESHLVVTASSYRAKMERVGQLRSLHCQFIYLTATLPPCMLPTFKDRLLLQQPVIRRGSTARRDITYKVRFIALSSSGLTSDAVKGFRARLGPLTAEEAARAIIYCSTRSEVDWVANALGCPAYYSDSGTDEEKAASVDTWRTGGSRVIAATSAFGAGVDYPAVRLILHIGAPGNAVDFAQEVGRGGRDGRGCTSYVILLRQWQAKTRSREGELLGDGERAMQRFLDQPRCRLSVLAGFLDGTSTCCADGYARCDRCDSLGLVAEGEQLASGGEPLLAAEDAAVGGAFTGEADGAGQQLLSQREAGDERARQAFIQQLDELRGGCMICLSLRAGNWLGHSLDGCSHPDKRAFFDAKKRAMRGRGDKWIQDYCACFRCGLSQDLCGQLGADGCAYKDVAMPLAWALYRRMDLRGELEEACGRAFGSEGEYMAWLGRRRTVFGEVGSGIMLVASQLAGEMLSGGHGGEGWRF